VIRHRFPPAVEPDELGAVVHGPVVLARAPGIVAALRCVYAHTGGLSLRFVLRAEGVQAEAALRRHRESHAEPLVVIEVGEVVGRADASQARMSASDDAFDLDANFWIDELPVENRLAVTVAWPQAGLPEARTELRLKPWDPQDVLPLL